MLLALLVPAALASGPHAVEWADRTFDDPIAGPVGVRVYRPAAEGPFPLAVFLHGWLGQAWMYDGVCEDLASHGFVVTSLDTETGLVLDMRDYADDAVAALHAAAAWSADPADPLAGLVDDGEWIALGHSMGGGTLGLVLGHEPRIRTAVALMPYEGLSDAYDALQAWEGSLLVLSGTEDTTAPPRLQQEWFAAADATSRALLVEVDGMGHNAPDDLTWNEDPLPDDVQLDLTAAIASTFVRAEHGRDEALWAELVTDPDGIGVERWSRGADPVLWATLDGDTVSLGVAGPAPASAEVTFGTGPADEGVADGVPVATLDLSTGLATAEVALPDGDGAVWLAVRTEADGASAWTRAIELRPASPADPGPSDPETTPATPDAEPSSGCSTAPGGTVLGVVGAGLLVRRRRRG